MANLGQQLAEFGILNGYILEEAIKFPGYAELQAGNQLSAEQSYAFRKAVARTIVKHREKQAAHLQFTKLTSTQKVKEWIHGFAPFAKDTMSSLQPIIKIICYYMNWPYAEVWSQHDTAGSRTLRVAESFIYPYKHWFFVEPSLEKLAAFMDSYSITLPSRELPGDVFTSSKRTWGESCFRLPRDAKRRKLITQASLNHAFAVPLKGDRRQNVTHAVVFYAPVNGPRSKLAKKFLFPTAQDAVNAYRSVEVIHPDENESLDKAKARWGKICTRHGGIRSAKIADRSPRVQRSRSFTCATNALGEKL